MARPHLKISLPKPCSENWNDMTPQAKGRFCESCSTAVIDFSTFTDAQLKAYFLQKSGKTCGRFSASQLDKPIFLEESLRPNFLVKAFATLALFSGLASTVLAQSNSENQGSTHQLMQRLRGNKPKTVAKQPEKVSSDSLVILGRLLDSVTKEPMAFGAVFIKDTKIYSQTDIDGKFKIVLPDTFQLVEFTLSAAYVGYEAGNSLINRSELPLTRDFMLKGKVQMLELHMVGMLEVKKTPGFYLRSLWWKAKNLFHKDEYILQEE